MGYSNIKADRRHDADQRRIRELEAKLEHERARNAEQTAVAYQPQQTSGHVTVEKTSKALKKRLLLSWFLMISGITIGVGLAMAEQENGIQPRPTVAIFGALLPIGFILWIVTKVQIWWRHG